MTRDGEDPILILTQPFDPTADCVVEELSRRGALVFRCDPGEFPTRLTLAARLGEGWTGSLRLPDRTLCLDRVGCVYYRRPSMFELPDDLAEARWALAEARMGLGGVLSACRAGSTTRPTSHAQSTSRCSWRRPERPDCSCRRR